MFKPDATRRSMEFKQRTRTLFPGLGGRYDPPSPSRLDPDYVPQERWRVFSYTTSEGLEDLFSLWVDPALEQRGVPNEVTHYHLLKKDLQDLFKREYDEAVRTGAYVPPTFPALPPPSD